MLTNSHKKDLLIVIAPVWPDERSGYGIAVRSALEQYCQQFDRIIFIAVSDEDSDPPSPLTSSSSSIDWHQIYVRRRPQWLRFVQSLASVEPATMIRFLGGEVQQKLLALIDCYQQPNQRMFVVFEDIPLSSLAPQIMRRYPHAKLALRSHNVAGKIFENLTGNAPLAVRLAWRIEVIKLKRNEKKVLQWVGKVWTISQNDAEEYKKRYNFVPHGVIGICIDANRFLRVPHGDPKTLLYLGTADLRKGKGISTFITDAWPAIHMRHPETKFLLAGRHTEQYLTHQSNIHGLGFYENEADFLGKGAIFVNPQEIGSGIKIKSIIAMLAGKALVTTPTGIEGVAGEDRQHYLRAQNAAELAPLVNNLLENPEYALQLGKNARELAQKVYSKIELTKQATPLLKAFRNYETSSSKSQIW